MKFLYLLHLLWGYLLPFQSVMLPGPGLSTTPPSTAYITSFNLGNLRNNFSGGVGFQVNLTSTSTLTDVCRWVVSGNSGSHVVTVYLGVAGVGTTIIGTATVNTSGQTAGAFTCVSVTPTVMTAPNAFVVCSQELSGGDQWLDDNAGGFMSTGIGTVAASVVFTSSCSTVPNSFSNHNIGTFSYVPPNFKYR